MTEMTPESRLDARLYDMETDLEGLSKAGEAAAAAAPVAMTLATLAKTVTTPGTAVALSATALVVRAAWVRAKKATGLNAGKVFIGTSSVDKDTDQQHDLDPDEYWWIPLPSNGTLNLATVYIDAVNAGDGVTVQYLTA
jgi:hypothetical protein